MGKPANAWIAWLVTAPNFDASGETARGRLLLRVLHVLLAGIALAVLLALFDPHSQWHTIIGVFLPGVVCIAVAALLIQRRRLGTAAWLVSLFLFVLVTTIIVLFGGITGNNAVAYIVPVMLAGTCVSRRAALAFAILSVSGSGIVAILEHGGYLPPPLAPLNTFNAWIAVTVTLLVAAVLHNMAVANRDASLREATTALAQLRDAQAENETRALHGKALAELSGSALMVADAGTFCARATSVAASLLSADAVVYIEFDDEDNACVASAYGCPGLPSMKISARDTPLLSIPPRPLNLEDPKARAVVQRLISLSPESGLLVPIRGGYRTYGLLGAMWTDKHECSADEEQFLATIAGISANLFERERMLERAERAQKMEIVGRLAGGVAHDFNNLLTVMSGVSGLLEDSIHPDADQAALLADLNDSITRATLLGRQLLAFSRQQVVAPTALNLTLLITEFLPMAKRLVGDDITLESQLPDRPAYAHADRGSVEQILLNLIVNAREAMPDGGTIRIGLERTAQNGVALLVSDTGSGMDESTRGRLFQPFFTTKEQGTGLGLATVADIIGRLGGEVSVESQPGRGSTFHVAFPSPPHARHEPRSSEHPTVRVDSRARILLAEDHNLVRTNIVRMLHGSNCDVVPVPDGSEAMRLLERGEHFDLVVTDVTMPGMGGRQLAEQVRIHAPKTGILFISGHFDKATQELPEGARFLAKPFTREALLAAIQSALEASRGGAEEAG